MFSLPPDVQSASTTGTDEIIQCQTWWGNSRWVKHFKSDPKHPPSFHGDLGGWISRGEKRNSMWQKLRMLDSGVWRELQNPPESFPAALEHRGSALLVCQQVTDAWLVSESGQGWRTEPGVADGTKTTPMALDPTPQLCQKPSHSGGLHYCFFPCSPTPNFISVLPVLNSELPLKNSEYIA